MKEKEILEPGKDLKIEEKQPLLDLVEKEEPVTGQKETLHGKSIGMLCSALNGSEHSKLHVWRPKERML